MKVTLITPTPPDLSAFGVRSLSAYLRSKGVDTNVIFLPGSIGHLKEGNQFTYRSPAHVVDRIVDICKGSDVIGVSFMTSYFDRALQVTGDIKKTLPDIPLIWGGIHPSNKPEEALEYADMVCLGEGEEALLDVVTRISAGKEVAGSPGVWVKRDGSIIKSPLRNLIPSLDKIPHFDFSNSGHYVFDKKSGAIEVLDDELLKVHLPILPHFDDRYVKAFRTMTDRGCPHRCSYCNVSNIKEMYKSDESPYFRARSVESAVEELVQIKKRFPFVEAIQFFDDTFFARPLKNLEAFAKLYKEKVGLPFYCQASPNTLSEAKLAALIEAGLVYVEMGVQTGSDKIKKLYRRTESNEKIVEMTKVIARWVDKGALLSPDYHVIIDNPWETDDDTMDTVRLLYQIPKPYGLCISSLVFFPLTELYNKAVEEKVVENEMNEIYRKPFYLPPRRTYANFLIYLFTFQRFPKFLIGFLMNDRIVKRLSGMKLGFLLGIFYSIGETARLAAKGITALRRGDFWRITGYLRGVLLRDPLVAMGRKK
jgi:radical SAM superfamily enzyme YgiQ (UPF0313 family)